MEEFSSAEQVGDDNDAPTTLINEDEDVSATDEYWTEERLAGAQPVEPPRLSEQEFEELVRRNAPPAGGAPETQHIVLPSFDPDVTELVGGTPTEANVGQRPFWNGGVLFFTKSDGKDYYGTAEFVGSSRVLMTAAHCVMDGKTGQWHKNFTFRRAYKNGGGQKVGCSRLAVWSSWHTNGPNYAFDYSFIYASTGSSAGWLGFATGIPYASWTSIGYPKNYGGGKYMYRVDGTKGRISGNVVQMEGNPMGGGCSGGAWIGDLTIPYVGGNYAIGLNSFRYDTQPNNMYGPLFDRSTYDLYLYIKDQKSGKG